MQRKQQVRLRRFVRTECSETTTQTFGSCLQRAGLLETLLTLGRKAPVTGIPSGLPTGETSTNVFFRIHLTVSDSGGLQRSTLSDVRPRTATITLTTNPRGLQVTLYGQPQTAPIVFVGVAGMTRTIGTPSPQTLNSRQYVFRVWSDGGTQTHHITTPSANTTYTARFRRLK